MRPPHWLDKVIGDLREAGPIIQAIADCSNLRQAVEKGIEAGNDWERRREENPHLLGTSFAQEVRVAVVEAFSSLE